MIRPALCAIFASAVLLVAQPVLAGAQTDYQSIQTLIQQNHLADALNRANQLIAQNPHDAKARFLKGLILAEQNKTADAINIMTGLTEDFPELPEPWNNLAVLYAAQGKYDRAQHALEMAIHTNPSYATANENLGDLYARMASQAYDKALQIDKSNPKIHTKLALIKEIVTGKSTVQCSTEPDSNKSITPSPRPSVNETTVARTPEPASTTTKPVTNAANTTQPAVASPTQSPPAAVMTTVHPAATSSTDCHHAKTLRNGCAPACRRYQFGPVCGERRTSVGA